MVKLLFVYILCMKWRTFYMKGAYQALIAIEYLTHGTWLEALYTTSPWTLPPMGHKDTTSPWKLPPMGKGQMDQ